MPDIEEIEVDDDAVVTIEIDQKGPVETTPEVKVDDSVVEVKAEEQKKPRQRQPKAPESTEATQALQQALESAENARKAAEATAMSERRRAEDAIRVANQRSEEVKTYQTQADDRQTAIINNGIEAANRELSAATQEQQRAWEAGEFDKATAAGARMAKSAAALDRYETQKVDHENKLKQPVVRQQVEQPQSGGSNFDQFVSTMAPRAQAWMRLHPECAPPQVGGDHASHHKAMAGHNLALAKGLQEGSDDYFKAIEEAIGYRTAAQPTSPAQSTASVVTQATGGDGVQNQRQPARTPIPSAPVSRDVPSSTGVLASNKVRLTPQQQEIALISTSQRNGETEDVYRKRAFSQYASELIKATQEGKIGRLTH